MTQVRKCKTRSQLPGAPCGLEAGTDGRQSSWPPWMSTKRCTAYPCPGTGDTGDWWPNLPGSAWALSSLKMPALSINNSLCCSLTPGRSSWTAHQCPKRAAPSLATSSSGLTGEVLLVLPGEPPSGSAANPQPLGPAVFVKSLPPGPRRVNSARATWLELLSQTTQKSPSRTGFFHF